MNEQMLELMQTLISKVELIILIQFCFLISPLVQFLVKAILDKVREWRILRNQEKFIDGENEDEEL